MPRLARNTMRSFMASMSPRAIGATIGDATGWKVPTRRLPAFVFRFAARVNAAVAQVTGKLKLMFAAMTRAAERWRAIKITDFERRQMAALRQELDQEYGAQTGLAKPTLKGASHDQFSSRSRT